MDVSTIFALCLMGVLPFLIFHTYFHKFAERRRKKGEISKLLTGIKHANVFLGLTLIYPILLLLYFGYSMSYAVGPAYFIVPKAFMQMMVFLLSLMTIIEIGSVFGYVYFSNKLEQELER